jgi:ATP-dependent exoDNAse (exonuclease V) beta subunit
MTLHKSKGLEFDAVLLPELQRETRGRDQPLLLWEQFPTQSGEVLLIAPLHERQGEKDPLYSFLKYSCQRKEAHERGRLLYVGMTRAKQALHLFASLSQNEAGEIKTRDNSLLGLVWPTLSQDFCMVYDPVESEVVVENKVSMPSEVRLPADWATTSELIRTIPEEDNFVSMEEFSYAAHVHRQVGVLIHRMLYKMAIQGLAHWGQQDLIALAPHFEAQLRELGVHRDVKASVQKVIESLTQVLNDSRGRWILHAHDQHEAEAVYGSSIIDRTFIDEDGQRWVIDYKTASDYAEDQHEQYRRQLTRYAQIFVDRGEKNIRCALYYPLFGGWEELC